MPRDRRRPRQRRASAAIEGLERRNLLAASGRAGVMNPAVIRELAAEAYVWGLAPEFTQRFSTYNTTVGAPINTLNYGSQPAAWNNAATNAGDSSVVYINSFIDFKKTKALVLTVPASSDQYYVANYLDDYLNTIGSIGTRTTPSDAPTSYLLVGPNSPYARRRTVEIDGYRYRVLASDTNLNWMLIRVAANTLAPPSDPQSVANVDANVIQKFALNPLNQFARNGHQPVYPADYQTPAPTAAQVAEAAPYQNTPTSAVGFLRQLGTSVKNSPIPPRSVGLSGSSLQLLPPWVVPQYGASARYLAPSYGQQRIFRAFAAIGLTSGGYRTPSNWGSTQLQALQDGFEQGQKTLNSFISGQSATSSTNDWTILNTIIGTYPNNEVGYLFRSTIVLNGGSANIPLDAVYPSMSSYQGTATLDGNDTYSITFTPPSSSGATLPADGTYPPLVVGGDGNPLGFWAITLYQPDASEVAAPFLSQASVLNTSYSAATTGVLSVDAAAGTLTVVAPSSGTIVASTPILFGANASQYGLVPNTVYYAASAPTAGVDPTTGQATSTFQVSSQWIQAISPDGVPIQNSGGPGTIVGLQSPAGAGALTYGVVQPVSQLGSQQLDDGQLARNADGSLTIWFGPTLPAGAPASNWIPTPSTAYDNSIYPGQAVSTSLQILLRMYYPTPGEDAPSILPYQSGSTRLPESYLPPSLQRLSQGS